MIKYCMEKWEKNKNLLEEYIRNNPKIINRNGYKTFVEAVVMYILNDGTNDRCVNNELKWDINSITEIDDGAYQGTLLYLIPLSTYQPGEYEYLMTNVGYGSCTVCDTLQSIQDYSNNYSNMTEEMVKDFMGLGLDIVRNMIKPYNGGWRFDDRFDFTEVDVK